MGILGIIRTACVAVYIVSNLVVVAAIIRDARRTRDEKIGRVFKAALTAFFAALPIYAYLVMIMWVARYYRATDSIASLGEADTILAEGEL